MRLLAAGIALLAATAAPAQDPCAQPDNIRRVNGNGKCLVVLTFAPAEKRSNALAVWIHGDGYGVGPADYMVGYARGQTERYGMTTVVLLRPGYSDRNGNRSAGSDMGRRDSYTEANVDSVAAALVALKKHHAASKLLVIGHSGGAAIAGAILGRHPGIIDAAFLFACPCNLAVQKPDWYMSISPHTIVDKVPASSHVYTFTGALDSNTGPVLARNFVAALSARGVPAEFHEIPDQGHDMNRNMVRFDPFVAAINKELAADK